MKNALLGSALAAFMVVSFASCKKETQTPAEAGSAKIIGKVWTNLNEANDTLSDGSNAANGEKLEYAPAGTMVTFTIDGMDLDANPDGNYAYKKVVRMAAVDASGNYTIDLPSFENLISVEISFNEFDANVTRYGIDPADTTAAGLPATRQYRERFEKGMETISIQAGGVYVRDFEYTIQ
jgi:hypothetical protein